MLEATTSYNLQVYANVGFQEVEEFVMGKERASTNGLRRAGGEGVTVYAMIWWPPAKGHSEGT